MIITQKYLSCNRSGKVLKPLGVVIHNTANEGDSASSEFEYFNTGDRKASAHAFVDDTTILNTIPWIEVGWHAGPTANKQFIGVELCTTSDPAKFKKIWENATDLVAFLFCTVINQEHIGANNTMSHADVSLKWKETDHMDPIEYFKKFGKTMIDFKADVQMKIINIKQEGNKMSVGEAIAILTREGIINSPEYWTRAATVVVNLDALLINMAKKLKG